MRVDARCNRIIVGKGERGEKKRNEGEERRRIRE